MDGDATFSTDRRYRYTLERWWDTEKPTLGWVMLNPSVGTGDRNDQTLRRCIGYAKDWGYGSFIVCNLFALRSQDPTNLYDAPDPVGPENDRHLRHLPRLVDKVVVAWGARGDYLDRDIEVCVNVLEDVDLYALDTTKEGFPCHPLRQPADLEPKLYVRA